MHGFRQKPLNSWSLIMFHYLEQKVSSRASIILCQTALILRSLYVLCKLLQLSIYVPGIQEMSCQPHYLSPPSIMNMSCDLDTCKLTCLQPFKSNYSSNRDNLYILFNIRNGVVILILMQCVYISHVNHKISRKMVFPFSNGYYIIIKLVN